MNIDVILDFEIGPFIIYDSCYYVLVSFWTGYKENYLLLLINSSVEFLDCATNVHEELIPSLKKKKKKSC